MPQCLWMITIPKQFWPINGDINFMDRSGITVISWSPRNLRRACDWWRCRRGIGCRSCDTFPTWAQWIRLATPRRAREAKDFFHQRITRCAARGVSCSIHVFRWVKSLGRICFIKCPDGQFIFIPAPKRSHHLSHRSSRACCDPYFEPSKLKSCEGKYPWPQGNRAKPWKNLPLGFVWK